MEEIRNLTTELENPKTTDIDKLSAREIVGLINQEDQKVAEAVKLELGAIAEAADEIAKRFQKGGRIIYIGAGSSGRMGVLDAVELTPTFNVSSKQAFGIIAGGEKAMYEAVEGAEDSREQGVQDLKNINLVALDAVIGIAASGRTPYTIAALEYANDVGALSVSVSSNKGSLMDGIAQCPIATVVGPEVVTGSTRLKAGTSQKMVVNLLSTTAMILSGRVYKNYMVHVQPTNEKLVNRSIGIIRKTTSVDEDTARDFFEASNRDVSVAIVMIETKADRDVAKQHLESCAHNVRKAIEKYKEFENA